MLLWGSWFGFLQCAYLFLYSVYNSFYMWRIIIIWFSLWESLSLSILAFRKPFALFYNLLNPFIFCVPICILSSFLWITFIIFLIKHISLLCLLQLLFLICDIHSFPKLLGLPPYPFIFLSKYTSHERAKTDNPGDWSLLLHKKRYGSCC